MNNSFYCNIFDSKEIDLNPIKKKRIRVEEYDYEDDFIESFEGETEAVEIECNLENFFIYSGTIQEDHKKIIKKYNNFVENKLKVNFDFEKDLGKIYKKDKKWFNFIDFIIFNTHIRYRRMGAPSTSQAIRNASVRSFIDSNILGEEKLKILGESIKNDLLEEKDIEDYLCGLKRDIMNVHNKIKKIVDVPDKYKIKFKRIALEPRVRRGSDIIKDASVNEDNNESEISENKIIGNKNVSESAGEFKNKDISKLFNFKGEDELINYFLDFIVNYCRFYYLEDSEIVKNRCLLIITKFFAFDCTNAYRSKHYILEKIEKLGKEEEGFDMDEVAEGRFIKKVENTIGDL